MRQAAEAAHATVVGSIFHTFAPQGVSGVVVVEESHFSIHTWPEYGYAAVDCYTCGDCTPQAAHELILKELGAETCEVMTLGRGQYPSQPSIQIIDHHIEEAGVEVSPAAQPISIATAEL